jgi:hypothetical protein
METAQKNRGRSAAEGRSGQLRHIIYFAIEIRPVKKDRAQEDR